MNLVRYGSSQETSVLTSGVSYRESLSVNYLIFNYRISSFYVSLSFSVTVSPFSFPSLSLSMDLSLPYSGSPSLILSLFR